MAELLLELLSEEIPARMQEGAADDLKRLVTVDLNEAGLSFENANVFATPRRLTLVVDGIPAIQPDKERRGPRADAPTAAVEGFKGSLPEGTRVETRETEKGEFYFAVIEGRPIDDILHEIVYRTIWNFQWPKSMRWGNKDLRWVRPIQNLLVIFGGRVLHFPIPTSSISKSDSRTLTGDGSLIPSNQTRGHRFLAPEPFAVTDFDDYREKLRAAYVMLDAAERRAVIEQDAALKAKAEGLTVVPDAALIAENAGLVEWPVVLSGAIDPAFMDLPPEVLTTAMRSHQKYFTLTDAEGAPAPRFLMVANAIAGDGGKQIVAGNEHVLRARLADAKFFWDTDRKRSLESHVADLDGVTFHAKLGSLGEKIERIDQLVITVAEFVPGADESAVREAAQLAKADLTTGMVGEFPELQGVMGRYYALADGQPAEVADAIAEHYAPQGPDDRCPTAPVSIAVALADKIDTLVGFWAIGETPTGSKDTYALRRAALGVIRLVTENQLRLGLTKLFESAYQNHESTQYAYLDAGIDDADRGEIARDDVGPLAVLDDRETVSSNLLGFFADRLKVHLRESGVRHDLVSAVFALGGEDDLVRLLARVDALGAFVASEDGEHLLTAYRRAANIVRIEEKRDGVSYGGTAVDPELLREADEKAVAERLFEVSGQASAALEREEFATAMAAMATLRGPVDGFFDNVTVNCDDADLRRNRLLLLGQIRATLDRVADFSKIEG